MVKIPEILKNRKLLFFATAACLFAIVLIVALRKGPPREAEEGHPSAHRETEAEGIALSPEAIKNIELKTQEADFRVVEAGFKVNGVIKAKPDKFALVASRISGRIKAVHVNVGERVEKGTDLVDIETLQYGEPPPVVHLEAPLSGIVVERHVFVGEPISPQKQLFQIIDLSEVWAEGDLFEDYVGKTQEGQRVRLTVPAYPEEVFTGTIGYVSDVLDPKKRTAHFWAEIVNPGEKLKPEMFCELFIILGQSQQTLAVPKKAILGEGPEKFVFVDKGGSYVKQPVVLGVADERWVEIKEGLHPGDLVVTQGNYELTFVRPGKVSRETESHGGHAH